MKNQNFVNLLYLFFTLIMMPQDEFLFWVKADVAVITLLIAFEKILKATNSNK
ncbi:hypothetical protein SDC9_156121 [bioreactor metagenome]|uniref:Uncharacterized protein n=1 Tax=bioreactor metagenome TaxID=1076179 RepID=A0A645F3D3_9ZZZZ